MTGQEAIKIIKELINEKTDLNDEEDCRITMIALIGLVNLYSNHCREEVEK